MCRDLPADKSLSLDAALAAKQHDLSERLDNASWQVQLTQASLVEKAVLHSEAGLGGRAFLAAVPSGRTRLEPAVFSAELRFRLGVPDAVHDCWCPLCDGVLDRHSHHAATCVAGGERTLRHNAVRDVLFAWLDRAGFHPEKERPGLLLPQSPEDTHSAARRPADIYVPSLSGSPTALDFAITAPQRQETLALAGQQVGAAAAAYARHKQNHQQTALACAAQGVAFVPMVAEATGTWDSGAAVVIKHVARAAAARAGEEPGPLHSLLLQELCVAVRSHRARAALRRRLVASESL